MSQIQKIKLQDVRNFTVKISNIKGDVVGTGIIVSTEGKIVTCVHVVRDILKAPPRLAGDRQLIVHFPAIKGVSGENRHAVVSAFLPEPYEDDIMLLQLVDGPLPLPSFRVAILGKAEDSFDNAFRSYGFRRLPPYEDAHAYGEIQGAVNAPEGKILLADPLQIYSDQIDAGMSGAAVLDKERNLVIGVVSEAYRSKNAKDQYTAWAVDANVLALEPFLLPIQEMPLSRHAPNLLYYTNGKAIQETAKSKPSNTFYGAPLPLTEWVGRASILKLLNKDWMDSQYKLTSIIGVGGEGKSSLVRHWLEVLPKQSSLRQPDSIFWWNFNDEPYVDTFFDAVLEYMWSGQVPEGISVEEIVSKPEQFIAGMLGAKRYLFVLDGLESVQQVSGDQYGFVKDERLQRFLSYFATLSHDSHCLITSRVPLIDMIEYATYIQRHLAPLTTSEGSELLRKLRVSGSAAQLEELVQAQGGYALTISRLGTLLLKQYKGDITQVDKITTITSSGTIEERVSQILQSYEKLLTDKERTFLVLWSILGRSVIDERFAQTFCTKENMLSTMLLSLNDADLKQVTQRLTDYAILQVSTEEYYILHPLFQDFFTRYLNTLPLAEVHKIHVDIAEAHDVEVVYYNKKAQEEEAKTTREAHTNFMFSGMSMGNFGWGKKIGKMVIQSGNQGNGQGQMLVTLIALIIDTGLTMLSRQSHVDMYKRINKELQSYLRNLKYHQQEAQKHREKAQTIERSLSSPSQNDVL